MCDWVGLEKKIWVGLLGLIAAWAGYSVLLLIAHVRAGRGDLWQRYGLFPGATLGEFDLLGTGLHVLGMVFALAVVFVTTSMMCKITFQQLRGDDLFIRLAMPADLQAGHAGKPCCLAPLPVLALFALFVIGGVVIGWVAGWIPAAGEIVFALCFIPIFFCGLVGPCLSVWYLLLL